jgi:hypothetical protein
MQPTKHTIFLYCKYIYFVITTCFVLICQSQGGTPGTAGTIQSLDALSVTIKTVTPSDHIFIEVKNK